MKLSPIRDFIVGLFVLAGIAAIAYLSISIGDLNWHGPQGLKLWAAFDETGGLALRRRWLSPVCGLARFRQFRFRTIFAPGGYESRSVAEIADRYLGFDRHRRNFGRPVYRIATGADETVLKSGDQISYTESAVILERLIGQLIYGKTGGGKTTTAPATAP